MVPERLVICDTDALCSCQEPMLFLDMREQKHDNAVYSSRGLSPPLSINLRQT